MLTQTIYVPQYGWKILLYADFTCKDTDIVVRALENIDCHGAVLERAKWSMGGCMPNTGLTYSSSDYRTSVVVVYQTTSGKEFLNTLTHECTHVCAHIARSFLIKIKEEEFCELVAQVTSDCYPTVKEIL